VVLLDENEKIAQLVSIITLPQYRSQGIGAGLLNEVEISLKAKGYRQIQAVYLGDNLALEQLLAKRAWANPEAVGVTYFLNAERVKESPFVQSPPEVAEPYSFFPWRELSESDRQSIQEREAASPWYTANAGEIGSTSPFINEDFFDKDTSLGVRFDEKVIAWMLVSRVGDSEAHFTTLFVSPDHRRSQLGISLVMRCVKYAVYHDYKWIRFQTSQKNTAMHSMVAQYIRDYSERQETEKFSSKSLE
jgi:ribosomal protein S18 acetylase RimI-like enzyme